MGLYKPKTKLRVLYEQDSTIFEGLQLPEGMSSENVVPIILFELGDLDTLFTTPAEWAAYLPIWSSHQAINWQLELNALTEQYNPLENYSMQEGGSDVRTLVYGKSNTRTNNLSHAKTGTETDAGSSSATSTPGVTQTTENGRYGENSATAVPVEQSVTSQAGSSTASGTTGNTRTYNTTDADTGTQTDAESGTDTDTLAHGLTRSGNIGVTTSQQMLESEIALRIKWRMIDIIVADFKRDLFAVIW